jgi:hypothetical protein
MDAAEFGQIWDQKKIPVAFRRTGMGEKLWVRLPFAEGNGQWLQECGRASPNWNSKEKRWELPKSWFNEFVNRALNRFGKVYIIQPYNEQEVCAPACQNAAGHECQCSCMGRYHGAGGGSGWFVVSDAFAIRRAGQELACRLLVRTPQSFVD